MRWFWGYLSVLALLTIAGCAGTNSAAADQTPTPTWSMKIETADPSPPPLSSPVPPIVQPSLTPSGPPPPVDCAKLLTSVPSFYWQEQASPPATCKQAAAVLPKALDQHSANGDYTVDGWRCHSDSVGPYADAVEYTRITCTKGQLSVDMLFMYVKQPT